VPFVRPIDRFLPFPHLSWIAILQANPQADAAVSPSAAGTQNVLTRENG
jgi:hypothetical protein